MAAALKNGSVPSKERLLCLAAFIVGPIVFGTATPDDVPSTLKTVDFVIAVGLTLGGVVWCFRSYPVERQGEFADHFICLSIPVAVTVVGPCLVLAIGLLLILPDGPLCYRILLPLSWVVQVIFFWRLRYFLRVSY